MKTRLLSMLCVLTLGAAVLLERQVNPPDRDDGAAQAGGKLRLPAEEKRLLSKDKEDGKKEAQEKLRLSFEKVDESLAKVHESMTPELRAELRQRRLEKAREDYEGFFHTLQLSESVIHQALEVVLERETRYMDAQDLLQHTGFTKGGHDFAETRKVEQSVAEVQLRHLFGDERYEQLTAFEKENQAKSLARGMKIISKYQND